MNALTPPPHNPATGTHVTDAIVDAHVDDEGHGHDIDDPIIQECARLHARFSTGCTNMDLVTREISATTAIGLWFEPLGAGPGSS